MIQILNTALPVILILFIGGILREKKMIGREGVAAMKNVVVNITLPAAMLGAFATTKYSWKNIVVTVTMFVICLMAWLLGKIIRKMFHMQSKFVPFLSTGYEAGMLGYALFSLLYGSEKLGEFATVDLGQVLFVFTLYKVLLNTEMENQKAEISAGKLIKEMCTSPVVIAITAGVLIGATGFYDVMTELGVSTLFDTCTAFVSAPTNAVILLTIGYDLVIKNIAWGKVLSVSGVRIVIMIIMRILAGLVVRGIGLGDSLDMALNVMMILPPPYVLPVFADDEGEREYVSAALSGMTLLTIIAFMVLAAAV